jgi:hypothetical protein
MVSRSTSVIRPKPVSTRFLTGVLAVNARGMMRKIATHVVHNRYRQRLRGAPWSVGFSRRALVPVWRGRVMNGWKPWQGNIPKNLRQPSLQELTVAVPTASIDCTFGRTFGQSQRRWLSAETWEMPRKPTVVDLTTSKPTSELDGPPLKKLRRLTVRVIIVFALFNPTKTPNRDHSLSAFRLLKEPRTRSGISMETQLSASPTAKTAAPMVSSFS